MIKIQPIKIWNNGQTLELNVLNSYIVYDNLKDSMTLFYELGYEEKTIENEIENISYIYVQNGNQTIDGKEYQNLDTHNGLDINEEIYRILLIKLNLKKA